MKVADWHMIWLGPFLLTVLCMIAFALLFREKEIGRKTYIPEEAIVG